MPTYDYECSECKHRFEMFQSMKDDPMEKCLKCGGKVKKIIGAGAGIIFKGSGFYVNDYKKSSSSAGSSPRPAKSAASTAASTSSDTGIPRSPPPSRARSAA